MLRDGGVESRVVAGARQFDTPAGPVALRNDDEATVATDPTPAAEERFVTSFDIEPGERSIVHHVIVYVIPPDQVDTMQELSCAPPTALAFGAVLKSAVMPPE